MSKTQRVHYRLNPQAGRTFCGLKAGFNYPTTVTTAYPSNVTCGNCRGAGGLGVRGAP